MIISSFGTHFLCSESQCASNTKQKNCRYKPEYMVRVFLPRRLSCDYWHIVLLQLWIIAWSMCNSEVCKQDLFLFFLFYSVPQSEDDMKRLEEKIALEGKVLPGNVLNVGTFLNQRIDVPFMVEMGQEIARLYKDDVIDKILTVEASGIALAMTAAEAIGCNVVFAKKNKSANMNPNVYAAAVFSYTHGQENHIVVNREYLKAGERVLLVDDFLANGEALRGLIELCRLAEAEVVGCAVAVEKGFQPGGEELRARGVRVESLAVVDSMANGTIVFRSEDT